MKYVNFLTIQEQMKARRKMNTEKQLNDLGNFADTIKQRILKIYDTYQKTGGWDNDYEEIVSIGKQAEQFLAKQELLNKIIEESEV